MMRYRSDLEGRNFLFAPSTHVLIIFSCIPSDSECLIVKVGLIITQNDVDVGQCFNLTSV